jgi:hypothetical protein
MTEQIVSFTSDSHPYGLSFGQWTVCWWNWFLSTPKSISPVIDESGKFAAINQPLQDVWFLAGKLASEDKNFPNRVCNVPFGRAILIPVINCEANSLEYPELKTEQELLERVERDENTIIRKECLVDGIQVPVQRIRSDPPLFKVKINEDNFYQIKDGGLTMAAGDGYWVFLKPLIPGDHFISFSGSCEKGKLNSGANYILKVQKN